MNKNVTSRLISISLISLLLIASCTKDKKDEPIEPIDPLKNEKTYTLSVMNDIYYWYKDIRKNVDPKNITTLQKYFDTLLVEKDRWSWMMTGEQYLEKETGEYETYGASFAQPIDHYGDYSIKVRYVFDNSPFAEKGVKRGYTLTHINNVSVNTLIENGTINSELSKKSNNFTFLDLNGQSLNFSTSARVVSTRSVLKTFVITPQEWPNLPYNVGYMNYYTFNANMLSDIDNAINTLRAGNIKELILDLRYNGGGDGAALQHIVNLISPSSANGALIAKREHNDKYSDLDNDPKTSTYISRAANALELNRIFILTSKGTASASEVLLNGLRPLTTIVQVGRTSYGKPNGMYVIPYPQDNYTNPSYVLLPICFYSVNKLGQGNYEDGLVPDYSRPDDLYHDFTIEEDWIKSCLTYIVNGAMPQLPSPQRVNIIQSGKTITTEEDRAGYGSYLIRSNSIQ